MATTKLGTTKVAARSLDYADKKAVVRSGLNLDVNYAKGQMRALRGLYDKNDGVQAHTIIQSFKPGEVTPEQANEIGLELAQRVAEGYQVAIYTHNDTEHIHNHIVINSVHTETGRKYNSNAKQRHLVKEQNDKICEERGLSVVKEKVQGVRYTMAEKALMEKGITPWKEEIRQAVDSAKERAKNKEEFVDILKEADIKFKETNKTVTYFHPSGEKVRGKTLGDLYDKQEVELSLERNKNHVVEENKEEKGLDPIIQEQLDRFKKRHGIKTNGDFREPLIYIEEEQKLALLGAVSKNHARGHAKSMYGSEYGYKVFINEREAAFEGRIDSNSPVKLIEQLRASAKENKMSDVFERSLEDMRASNRQRQIQQRGR